MKNVTSHGRGGVRGKGSSNVTWGWRGSKISHFEWPLKKFECLVKHSPKKGVNCGEKRYP